MTYKHAFGFFFFTQWLSQKKIVGKRIAFTSSMSLIWTLPEKVGEKSGGHDWPVPRLTLAPSDCAGQSRRPITPANSEDSSSPSVVICSRLYATTVYRRQALRLFKRYTRWVPHIVKVRMIPVSAAIGHESLHEYMSKY